MINSRGNFDKRTIIGGPDAFKTSLYRRGGSLSFKMSGKEQNLIMEGL
jgi:hypothetical protein